LLRLKNVARAGVPLEKEKLKVGLRKILCGGIRIIEKNLN